MENLIQPFSDITIDRRGLIKGAGAASLSLMLGGLLTSKAAANGPTDADILGAAKIAEALATTMYTGIINESPWFATLDPDDQDYFRAARDHEKYHYDLLKSVTGNTDAGLSYYFPNNMFTNVRRTFSILVTLEDIFIAAYLLGVRAFSSNDLKVISAQIMGIESDHRTLGRLVAAELGETTIVGFGGTEPLNVPNNNIYERTYAINSLDRAVRQLLRFIDPNAAAAAGYTKVRTFDPSYQPNFPNLYGNPPA
ncbi:MAG: ferritin-like domain-containing protein [Fimbriimonadaceae bacterium]|nr:ferritin-like domain-containing protein [Fimbriimonadaceae bacterium]